MARRPRSSLAEPQWGLELTAEGVNRIPGYDAIATAGDCRFIPEAAAHVLRFLSTAVCFAKGKWSGKPMVLLPWQVAIVANAFGWYRPDGTRRYRRVGLWVPRKAGKTELLAGIGHYHHLADDEPTPEVYVMAKDGEQAGVLFGRAIEMAKSSPLIADRVRIVRKAILCPGNGGFFKIRTADAGSAHGASTSALLADEIHALGNDRDLWDAMTSSMGARDQPLTWSITTAGILPESLEASEHEYASKVRDGTFDDPSFLPVIYEAGIDDDWTSPAVWRRANPSLGVTVPESYYAEECRKAERQPRFETTFRTLYLNQRVTASVRWLRLADWNACYDDDATHEPEALDAKLRGKPFYLGIDFGSVDDLCALFGLWLDDGGRVHYRAWCYAPREAAERRAELGRVPYLQWAEKGWLTLTPGDTTDYGFLLAEVERLAKRHRVTAIGYDPNNAGDAGNRLDALGFTVRRVPQSFSALATATRRFEADVRNHKAKHDGNPVLKWCVSNAVVEQDANENPRPSKRRSVEKIDAVVAGVIAQAVALEVLPVGPSPYNERGVTWL